MRHRNSSKHLTWVFLVLSSLVIQAVSIAQNSPLPLSRSVDGKLHVLKGAGSIDSSPLVIPLSQNYQSKYKVRIDFHQVGQKGAIELLKRRDVNFIISDSRIYPSFSPVESKKIVEFPIGATPVAVTYNLSGNIPLHLTGHVLAEIYLGHISYWDDRSISILNPKTKLPHKKIVVLHHSSLDGVTQWFRKFLSVNSSAWRNKTMEASNWPVGFGPMGSNNEINTNDVPWSIGYSSLSAAIASRSRIALLSNKKRQFVGPNKETTTSALNDSLARIASHQNFPCINADGVNSYPIVGLHYLAAYQQQKDTNSTTLLMQFIQLTKNDYSNISIPSFMKIPKSLFSS